MLACGVAGRLELRLGWFGWLVLLLATAGCLAALCAGRSLTTLLSPEHRHALLRMPPDHRTGPHRGNPAASAARARSRARFELHELQTSVERLLETHDLLAMPCVGVLPFDRSVRFPVARRRERGEEGGSKGGGQESKPAASMRSPRPLHGRSELLRPDHLEWLGQTSLFSLTRCPAVAIPCGTTAGGLPVSLQVDAPSQPVPPRLLADWALTGRWRCWQLVGRPHQEHALLAAAALYEAAHPHHFGPAAAKLGGGGALPRPVEGPR